MSKRTSKVSGKNKGNNYERKIAKLLGEFFFDDKTALWRSTNSGSRATVVKQGLHPGDIVPNKPSVKFPLAIECKNSESWSFDHFMKPRKKYLIDWWSKLVEESGRRFIPWLIFTKNHHDDYVMMRSDVFQSIEWAIGNVLKAKIEPKSWNLIFVEYWDDDHDGVMIIPLRFITLLDGKELLEFLRDFRR